MDTETENLEVAIPKPMLWLVQDVTLEFCAKNPQMDYTILAAGVHAGKSGMVSTVNPIIVHRIHVFLELNVII